MFFYYIYTFYFLNFINHLISFYIFFLQIFYSKWGGFLKKIIIYFCFLFFIFSLFLIYSATLISKNSYNTSSQIYPNYYFSNEDFFWPTPGYHTITSAFGKRISPTTGASSNHSGIDIAATEGSSIYSILSGVVTHTGFYGANGHTVIIENNLYTIIYAHVSPNYIVNKGTFVNQANIIAHVGPKYISDVLNNPYKDSSGKSTNGATTGPHLHLTIKKDNVTIDPLLLFY